MWWITWWLESCWKGERRRNSQGLNFFQNFFCFFKILKRAGRQKNKRDALQLVCYLVFVVINFLVSNHDEEHLWHACNGVLLQYDKWYWWPSLLKDFVIKFKKKREKKSSYITSDLCWMVVHGTTKVKERFEWSTKERTCLFYFFLLTFSVSSVASSTMYSNNSPPSISSVTMWM